MHSSDLAASARGGLEELVQGELRRGRQGHPLGAVFLDPRFSLLEAHIIERRGVDVELVDKLARLSGQHEIKIDTHASD